MAHPSVTDLIAQPWGERTPYPSGDDVDSGHRSASILHSNGDAIDIAIKDGRIVGVRGRADDRINRGRLGPKDL